ncbi:MAG: hypothetical protein ACREQ8_06795, partial [Woeseiaceae bacterium]
FELLVVFFKVSLPALRVIFQLLPDHGDLFEVAGKADLRPMPSQMALLLGLDVREQHLPFVHLADFHFLPEQVQF